jgi:hypothetical protein
MTFGTLLDMGFSLRFWIDIYGNIVQPFGTHTIKPSTRRPVWSFIEPPNPPHLGAKTQWNGSGNVGCGGVGGKEKFSPWTTAGIKPHMFAV